MLERYRREEDQPVKLNGVTPLELSAQRVSLDSSGTALESPAASSWTSLGQEGGSMDGASQMALATTDEDDDDVGGRCGWGPIKPHCVQSLRTARWVLAVLCLAGALQGMVVNGFVNVVITTIERRFDLRSTETGLIAGAYDIASFVCLVPVSYFGGAGRKPRWIGLGVMLMGVGSFLFAMPHFTAGPYTFNEERNNVCHLHPSMNDSDIDVISQRTFCERQTMMHRMSNYKWVFMVGQLLHGAGAAPLYTLGVTFLDESVTTKMSSVYIGTYYAMAVIGPAVGYLLGGQFLKIYTDVGLDSPHTLGLSPSSNVWVGAWWIGFLMSGMLAFLVAIPILGFPKILPGAKRIQADKVSEAHGGSFAGNEDAGGGTQIGFSSIKDLPKSLRTLAFNPCFMFLNVAGACEALLLNGFAAFLPKYIESQFVVQASWAALMVGCVTVPAGGGGTFLGGYLVKRLSLRCAGIIKMCILFTMCALLCTLVFLMNCPNIRFAGINEKYESSITVLTEANLSAPCSQSCHCREDRYDPICGTDNIMYYSPCYAGCERMHPEGDKKLFSNCACVHHGGNNVTINKHTFVVTATGDMCQSSCQLLPAFLAVIFCLMVFTFLTSMPALSATLRCVPSSQRSLGLGIQWLIVRLLGSIPAPILFGALVDSTCSLWQKSCGELGSCRAYDNAKMSRNMLTVALVGKGASLLCFTMAWIVYKAPEKSISNEGSSLPTIIPPSSKNVKISVITAETDDSGYAPSAVTPQSHLGNGTIAKA